MASIDKRPDGRYRARWREYAGGPQKVRHFARKRDAEQFLDAVRGDLAHGMYVDPAGGRTLFQEYAERWRSVQVHRTGTTTQVETYLRLNAYPQLGTRQLGAIRRSDVQAWVKELTGVLAPRSVELAYRWVATIFKAAVGDRLIASSPCIGITLPKCTGSCSPAVPATPPPQHPRLDVAPPSRPSSAASATSPPPRHSTPTAISGPTPTTRPATLSTSVCRPPSRLACALRLLRLRSRTSGNPDRSSAFLLGRSAARRRVRPVRHRPTCGCRR